MTPRAGWREEARPPLRMMAAAVAVLRAAGRRRGLGAPARRAFWGGLR